VKQVVQSPENTFRLFQLAFPNRDDFPARLSEFTLVFPIIGNIPFEFLFPEGFVGCGSCCVFAPFVAVPETAVNEDNRLVFRQDYVRLAGQIFNVFPESVTRPVQYGSNEHFRFRVLSANATHNVASLFRRENVHGYLMAIFKLGSVSQSSII
jgi:hypothetical protein